MSKLTSKLKAVAIHGPPVVVDAAIRLFRRMQFRLMEVPEPCIPKKRVGHRVQSGSKENKNAPGHLEIRSRKRKRNARHNPERRFNHARDVLQRR